MVSCHYKTLDQETEMGSRPNEFLCIVRGVELMTKLRQTLRNRQWRRHLRIPLSRQFQKFSV